MRRDEFSASPGPVTRLPASGVVQLFTDGAALRNPHGPAGWAWLAVSTDGFRQEGVGNLDRASNNQAELTAAIEGLNALPRSRVRVYSDSLYLVKGMSTWIEDWQRRGWRTKGKRPVKNQSLWEALLAAVERHETVEWKWVRGHNGQPENERVNDLTEGDLAGEEESMSLTALERETVVTFKRRRGPCRGVHGAAISRVSRTCPAQLVVERGSRRNVEGR